jgi:hypothetical protein
MKREQKMKVITSIMLAGAAADALWTAALVWTPLYAVLTGRPLVNPAPELRLAMWIGAALMAGWTVLLVWAARRPVERRAIMLITALPVVAGLLCVALTGAVNYGTPVWLAVKCVFLESVMLAGFYMAAGLAKEQHHEISH